MGLKYKMTIKLATYNIDGLPEQLDLRQLPWVLRQLAWAYRLAKGTYMARRLMGETGEVQKKRLLCLAQKIMIYDRE